MKSFHWGEHFITGLTDIDAQHRHLVDIINKFGSLLTESEITISDVDRIYRQLAEYAVHHFQGEEALMAEAGVDPRHVEHHRGVHEGFLDEVTSLYSGISAETLDQAGMFLKFLIHWLAYHVLGEDQDLAKQVLAIRSGMPPREAYRKMEQERVSATAPLLEALNGLFEQVSIRNRELKQLNESLEEKVAQRTKELSEANRHLEELSLTDVLTGLPNRRHAMRRLTTLWNESLQKGTPLACMMIDADHFKEVNDQYGHDAGDRVLLELAKTLQGAFRNDDVVCRLGGDEFFVICPKTDNAGGLHAAELARRSVAELRVQTGGTPWHGSISVGVACRHPGIDSYEALIKEADKGVYAAKEAGKNCVRSVGSSTSGP